MQWATCQCDAGGTVSVQGPDFGATFGRGAHVDLDAVVASGSRVTWRQALGRYASLFVPVVEESAATPSRRRARESSQESGE